MTKTGWLDQYIGTHSRREIARARRVLERVEEIGETVAGETDQQLKERAEILRHRARSGNSLTDLMAETFAVVREVSSRQLGMRHFDVQILGGVALQRGNIVEMKTGEGKTLVATLPVVLNALAGKGVHLITVNDYLAERDARWMAPVYEFMGLSVGVIKEDMDDEEAQEQKKLAYQADITYVTNHDLVFDYLRDNLAGSRDELLQRPLNFALIDEVDLLLLDEAGTPLILSGPAPDSSDHAVTARNIVSSFREGEDFLVDYKTRRVSIQEHGWARMETALGLENLAAPEHIEWQHALHNALLAHAVYQRDVDYVVDDGEVLLVDDFTGRVSPDKRLSDGLHQALEAKERVVVQAEDRTLASVSYQMFFKLYPSLSGMTGTAHSAREEIRRTYGLRIVVIPTNKPTIRIDQPASVFKTSTEKFEAVVQEIHELTRRGRPVLVGTTSVRESEQLSQMLRSRGIEHTVLNAKDDSTEADIIAQAGRPSAVTVSTNMAGRGVDIVLGGNPEAPAAGGSDSAGEQYEEDRERVVKEGGLMVIGTGLHESKRLDDQLRGRSGRQGDPGGSHYFLSLDDPIYRKFGEPTRGNPVLQDLRQTLRNHPPGQPITDRSILRTLRELQKKVEVENESIRREVLRYDMVIDDQRRTIYGWRQTILARDTDEMIGLIWDMVSYLFDDESSSENDAIDDEARQEMSAGFREMLCRELNKVDQPGDDDIHALIRQRLKEVESAIGEEQLATIAGKVMLATIDNVWTEHLGNLERVDDAVGLRGYAQLDPLMEFKKEAHNLYQTMLVDIRIDALTQILIDLADVLDLRDRPLEPQ